MSAMYVANCTQQTQDFQYQLPEKSSPTKQTIPIGQQIKISGDLSTPDIEAIVRQHSPYGLVAVSEIDRTRDFIGVCYQLDRPVNMERVRYAIGHNRDVLDARGRQIRQEAAVSVNNSIEEQHPDFKALEMEVVEVAKAGKDIEVNEKTRVTRTEEPSGPAPKRTYRRKAA